MPETTPQRRSTRRSSRGLAIGIDVGGTGVKAAVVDLATGELRSPRVRRPTPQPPTPGAVIEVAAAVVNQLIADGHATPDMPAGCGLPGVVKDGRLKTAANLDAAGIAEMAFGAARDRTGTVLLLTIGTGIGSALFVDGVLVPNTELGHVHFHGRIAEALVSAVSRERRKIGWKRWAREFSAYLALLESYFWPDLIILGGGISKAFDRYGPHLVSRAPIVTASLLNSAGIVGAAVTGEDAARTGIASRPSGGG